MHKYLNFGLTRGQAESRATPPPLYLPFIVEDRRSLGRRRRLSVCL